MENSPNLDEDDEETTELPELPPREDNRLKDFLHELVLSETQMQEIYQRFTAEIRKGLGKKTHCKSELKCYPTYVQAFPNGTEEGKYLALDLGGPVFRLMLVTLKGALEPSIETENYEIQPKLLTGTGEELFNYIAKCFCDFVKKKNLIEEEMSLGFTFSFPYKQAELTRGMLVRWAKGIDCPDVVNQDFGRMFTEALARRSNLKVELIAIQNETTGCLMSCAHRNTDCRIGLIIDNECNACYKENTDYVELLETKYRNKQYMIINTELSAFGDRGNLDFVRTEFDYLVDKLSENKGTKIFEKMLAAPYLCELVRLVLLRCNRENLVFTSCAIKKKISDILQKKVGCFEFQHLCQIDVDEPPNYDKTKRVIKLLFGLQDICEEDCENLKIICNTIVKRAANLIGIAISGLINKMQMNYVEVGVDGSVYRNYQRFDEYMRDTISRFVVPDTNFEIIISEDGCGRGAAITAAAINISKISPVKTKNETDDKK